YDPRQSNWVSPDPILARYLRGTPNGGVFAPKNLGLYGMAWNNPVTVRDPTGMAPKVNIKIDEPFLIEGHVPHPPRGESQHPHEAEPKESGAKDAAHAVAGLASHLAEHSKPVVKGVIPPLRITSPSKPWAVPVQTVLNKAGAGDAVFGYNLRS